MPHVYHFRCKHFFDAKFRYAKCRKVKFRMENVAMRTVWYKMSRCELSCYQLVHSDDFSGEIEPPILLRRSEYLSNSVCTKSINGPWPDLWYFYFNYMMDVGRRRGRLLKTVHGVIFHNFRFFLKISCCIPSSRSFVQVFGCW